MGFSMRETHFQKKPLTGDLPKGDDTARLSANAIAMSVYLWHMTAGMIVIGCAYLIGQIPAVEAGTYQVVDSAGNVRSSTFKIEANVYRPVLIQAVREAEYG